MVAQWLQTSDKNNVERKSSSQTHQAFSNQRLPNCDKAFAFPTQIHIFQNLWLKEIEIYHCIMQNLSEKKKEKEQHACATKFSGNLALLLKNW